ncbi:MAG: DUF1601 domain-containing protein [Pseudomonadota bacterium]
MKPSRSQPYSSSSYSRVEVENRSDSPHRSRYNPRDSDMRSHSSTRNHLSRAQPNTGYRSAFIDFKQLTRLSDFKNIIQNQANRLENNKISGLISRLSQVLKERGSHVERSAWQSDHQLKRALLALTLPKLTYFNPKDLSITLNGLAQLGYNHKDLQELNLIELAHSINQQASNFNPQNIANTLNGLAKLGYNHQDFHELNLLMRSINHQASNFNPQHIANTLNGLANLGYNHQDLHELNLLMRSINHQASHFNPQAIANTLNGLAKLGYSHNHQDLQELNLIELVHSINQQASHFNPQDIANTLNGLAKLGYNHNHQDLQELNLIKLVHSINQQAAHFNPQHITNTLNGLAKLGYNHQDLQELNLFSLMRSINQQAAHFDPQAIANTLNGLANLGYNHQALHALNLSQLLDSVNQQAVHFNPQEIANTLNGLANLGYEKLNLIELVHSINQQAAHFNPQNIANTLNGLAKLGYNHQDLQELNLIELVHSINKQASNFNPQAIANTLNGFAQLGFGEVTTLQFDYGSLLITLIQQAAQPRCISLSLNACNRLNMDFVKHYSLVLNLLEQVGDSSEITEQDWGLTLQSLQALPAEPRLQHLINELLAKSPADISTRHLFKACVGFFSKNSNPPEVFLQQLCCLPKNEQSSFIAQLCRYIVRQPFSLEQLCTALSFLKNILNTLDTLQPTRWKKALSAAINPSVLKRWQHLNLENNNNTIQEFLDYFSQHYPLQSKVLQAYADLDESPEQSLQIIDENPSMALAESTALHALIDMHAEETQQQPITEISSHKISQYQAVKASLQRIHGDFSCATQWENTLRFGQLKSTDDLVLMVPTRGVKPDLETLDVVHNYIETVKTALQSTEHSLPFQLRIILGLNAAADSAGCALLVRRAEMLNAFSVTLSAGLSVVVEIEAFTWQANHERDHSIIPYGSLRHHLFQRAKNKTLGDPKFCSLDGDIVLTPKAMSRILKINSKQVTTFNHQIPKTLQSQHPHTYSAFALNHYVQSLSNRIINNEKESINYLREFCMVFGKDVFHQLRDTTSNFFGRTDSEGRFVMRHIQNINSQIRFIPVDSEAKITLTNFARFEVQPAVKNIQSWQDLGKQLSSLTDQSQNMANFDFFTRQLAFTYGIQQRDFVSISKLIYPPNLLKQGISVQKIYAMLQEIEKSIFKQEIAITPYAKKVVSVSQQFTNIHSNNKVLMNNLIAWSKQLTRFTEKQLMPLHLKELNSAEFPEVIELDAASYPADTTAPYSRNNLMARDTYPPAQKRPAENTQEPIAKMLRLDLARFEPVMIPVAMEDIEPHQISAPARQVQSNNIFVEKSLKISGTPNNSANKSIALKLDIPAAEEKKSILSNERKPKILDLLKDKKIKELFGLLNPNHFGINRLMDENELSESVVNYLIDPVEGMNLAIEDITKKNIIILLSDLLLGEAVRKRA